LFSTSLTSSRSLSKASAVTGFAIAVILATTGLVVTVALITTEGLVLLGALEFVENLRFQTFTRFSKCLVSIDRNLVRKHLWCLLKINAY